MLYHVYQCMSVTAFRVQDGKVVEASPYLWWIRGRTAEDAITRLTKFGAFVRLATKEDDNGSSL